MSKARTFLEKANAILQKNKSNYDHPAVQYITEAYQGDGLYIKVVPEVDSDQEVIKRLDALGVDHGVIFTDELHITILYDRKATESPEEVERIREVNFRSPYLARVQEMKTIIGHNDKRYLILELDSPILKALHDKWIQSGFSHSFPQYLPHMTLCKEPNINEESHPEQFKSFNDSLKDNPLIIKFGHEIVDEVRKD
ncbi:hypothetical protein [Ralstonia phage RP13]|nr:hypothetical protein [Ralstonia phage RP13]